MKPDIPKKPLFDWDAFLKGKIQVPYGTLSYEGGYVIRRSDLNVTVPIPNCGYMMYFKKESDAKGYAAAYERALCRSQDEYLKSEAITFLPLKNLTSSLSLNL